MAIEDADSTVTRLLTLLNVSVTKLGKRKWETSEESPKKLNKRKVVRLEEPVSEVEVNKLPETVEEPIADAEEDTENPAHPYETHFGANASLVSGSNRALVDSQSWRITQHKFDHLGPYYLEQLENVPTKVVDPTTISDRRLALFNSRGAKRSKGVNKTQTEMLSVLLSYQDLYQTTSTWENKAYERESIALHALNHISKKRKHVLKNNERLSNATKSNSTPPDDVQDQGFTRPSVLILLPFRSSALEWFNALSSHLPSPSHQIENQSRFTSEYGLPEGTLDKLATAEPGTYPEDHVETFKGNIDDNFRIGIKMTRKSLKLFAEFYRCDIIIASPLGLRQSIQKEKNSDYLSSIELLVIDQMDALTMQNWEHVKFVLERLNKMPQETHDADFSRIKPWYLDGCSEYLRQSVLLSAYETPETRHLFNTQLKNVAGRIRLQSNRFSPINVPAGVDQNFIYVDSPTLNDDADRRFAYFTTTVLPSVLKSAVQSANTIVFIPSSFDFIRVHNYFRKQTEVTFTVLSEYSTNQEISRARQAFFSGQRAFLLLSERFHFYRRYKIRGLRNLIFYGPPSHPQFYTELLSYPFLDSDVEPADVTCKVLFSKYDWFAMERMVGTTNATRLVKQ